MFFAPKFKKASLSEAERKQRLDLLTAGFQRKLNQEGGIGAIKADPTFRFKAATLIREMVNEQHIEVTPMPLALESRRLTLGDKYEFTRVHGRNRVVRYVPGAHPITYTATRSKHSYSTAQYEVAWGVPLYEIALGQITMEQVIQDGANAKVRHEMDMLFTSVNAAVSATAKDVYGDALRTDLAGDLTQTALDAAIERMSRYNSGLRIWGTHKTLNKIFGFIGAAGADSLTEQYITRGTFGAYKGCALQKIEFGYDEYAEEMPSFDGISFDNCVLITADQSRGGGVFIERDISMFNDENLNVEQGHWRVVERMDQGIYVAEPWRFHIMQLNKA